MPTSLTLRTAILLIAVGLFSLGAAFGSQYFGGLQPCILCIYQRYPYGVVITLGVLLALLSRHRALAVTITALAAVALFVVGAIAEARHTHTVWGQGGMFWMLLGFAAVAFEFAAPRYTARLRRR